MILAVKTVASTPELWLIVVVAVGSLAIWLYMVEVYATRRNHATMAPEAGARQGEAASATPEPAAEHAPAAQAPAAEHAPAAQAPAAEHAPAAQAPRVPQPRPASDQAPIPGQGPAQPPARPAG
jgi:cytoskeletal protein RodZ